MDDARSLCLTLSIKFRIRDMNKLPAANAFILSLLCEGTDARRLQTVRCWWMPAALCRVPR
jgi:hypothetical protein